MIHLSEPIIEFKNVSKEYFLYSSNKARFFSIFNNNRDVKKHVALKDVSFEVRAGESVGIVGKNGAGKSTILKMITGVCFPTAGEVIVKKKVAALLELTAGFSPELTGRENIYLKGYILGLTDRDIKLIEQDIVDFASIDEYIDQPVRTYSSGMRMRLGFAININIRPEILVVDEALSVGDAEFRAKCKNRIRELITSGVTVLYVSHSVESVKETCDRAIYLEKGRVRFDGTVDEAFQLYKKPKK
ncbi:MAG: ABC transporter ATP-binding protein [Oscillospiraceae bacterium]